MNRKILFAVSLVSIVSLSACGLTQKKESPEEMIKKTQINVIKSIKQTALAKQNVEFDSNIKVNVSTPMGGGNANLTLNGKTVGYTGEISLGLDGQFSTQIPQKLSGSINSQLSLKTSLSKIYLKLANLDIKISDPTLAMYTAMANMIVGKRLYVDNTLNTKDINSYRNLDLEKIFNENPIFKPTKVIKENEFEVSLNKDSIVNIIYEIAKQTNPTITGYKNDIKKELGSGDIVGVLKIRDNKYFTFSGNVINSYGDKVALEVKYKKDKFYINIANVFKIDLDKNGDSFKGIIYLQNGPAGAVSLPVEGLLNAKEFKLNIKYIQAPINASVLIDYKILRQINSINLEIPKDAVSIEQLLGGFGLPQQIGK